MFIVLLFGRVAFLFLAVWAGGVTCFFFNCFFCCLGGGVFLFAVWAGGVGGGAVALLFGRGGLSFFCCLGGGRDFTHLPVCLARL